MQIQTPFVASSGSGGGGVFPPTSPAITPAWFLADTFIHTDFQIAATSRSIALYTLPAKGVIHGICVVPTIQFDGAEMSSYQISCGIAGDEERYSSLLDVFNIVPGNSVMQTIPLLMVENLSATTPLLITANSNVNLDNSAAGSVAVYLCLAVLP